MVPLDKFQAELRFEYPDLPEPLFAHYLARTARDMARRGRLVRRRAVIRGRCGVSRHLLEPPDGMEIDAVLGIRFSTCCGHEIVGRTFTPPEHSSCCSRETAWYDDTERVLHVDGTREGVYHVELSVLPPPDACTLPSVFYDRHFQALLLGTRGSILMITGRPWTNLQLGRALYSECLNEIVRADLETATHGMRGAVMMNFGKVM